MPDMPVAEIRAPMMPVEAVVDVPKDARVAAVFGGKDIGSLQEYRNLENLWISGGNEKAYSELRSLGGLRQLVIHNYRGANIGPLSQLVDLTSLAIAGSPKLKSLEGIEPLKKLRTLILFANCGYSNIVPLAGMPLLETLCLEGGAAKPLKIESLKPLQSIGSLIILRLASIRVIDQSLRALHQLMHLRKVFIANTFLAEELQGLADALPLADGEFLNSYRNTGSKAFKRKM